MKQNLVSLVVLMLSGSGCLSQGDPIAPPHDSMGGLFGAPDDVGRSLTPVPETKDAQNLIPQVSSADGPVTFTGHIIAPDASHWDYGFGCFGYGGGYGLAANGTIHVHFTFQEQYDNWSFMFDSSGFEATFWGGQGTERFGKVPSGSTGVTVCSRHAVNAEFELTLVPPTSTVLSGHIFAPGLKQCFRHTLTDHVSSQWFALDRSYDGWTFAFSADGFVGRFHGPTWHSAARAGTVPDGAEVVVICSKTAVDSDFRLILSPPALDDSAGGAQQHAGAWYAGLMRPNAPCFSNGLPVPSDPVADGVLYDSFRINPATRGQPYKIVVTDNVAEEAPFLIPGVFLRFYDSTGEEARVSSFAPKDSEGRIRPLVPDEATRGVFSSCETGPVRATYFAGAFIE